MTNPEDNFVCLITGPAGAGKSSVSRALAKKFNKSAFIDVDELRNMVIGGYVKPWPWNEEVKLQLSLSTKNACDISSNFLEQGFNVFIDVVLGENLLKEYSEFFVNKKFKVFLLLPTIESLLARFDERGANDKLRERTFELHKKFLEKKDKLDWQVIDSSNQTLEETVDQIYQELVQFNS